jgi:hypothetical protein
LEDAASNVGVTVAVSAEEGVSEIGGVMVSVTVAVSVAAKVGDGVSGVVVALGFAVIVEKRMGVKVGRTIGRMVGIKPMHAARITPKAPIIATMISVASFFWVISCS